MTQELKNKYYRIFGRKNFEKLLNAKKQYSNNQFIRFNFTKTNNEETSSFLKKNRVKFSNTFFDNSFKIEKSFFNISSTLNALTSKIYIQDLASQIPVNCLDLEKFKKNNKIKVLDMAASPGSKTTQIYDILKYNNFDFEITALEPDKTRLTKLINNIQKQQCENIKIINTTGQNYNGHEKFDIILLDAPCSGNLIGDKNWLQKRDQKGILDKAKLQKDLLKKASALLKENGELIYSTCSLEIEENEQNVDWIVRNSKLINIPIGLKLPFDTKPLKKQHSLRIMPYESKTQGFFVSKFTKK